MNQKGRIHVETALTAKDQFSFTVYEIRIFLTIIFILIFIGLFLLSWNGNFFDHSIMLSLIAASFSTLIVFLISWLLAYQLVKSRLNKDPLLKQTVSYEIGIEGLLITTIRDESSLFWSDLYMVREQKNFFALFISKSSAFILSKHSFQSAKQIELFKKLTTDLLEPKRIYFK